MIINADEEYYTRVKKRHIEDFPTKEELKQRIEKCEADVVEHLEECRAILADVAKKEEKLPGLRKKVALAEAALADQRSVIQLLKNRETRARKMANTAAKDKAGYEAQYANKDWKQRRLKDFDTERSVSDAFSDIMNKHTS